MSEVANELTQSMVEILQNARDGRVAARISYSVSRATYKARASGSDFRRINLPMCSASVRRRSENGSRVDMRQVERPKPS
jgi:hypothetical protein